MVETIMFVCLFALISIRLVLYFVELVISSRYDQITMRTKQYLEAHPHSRLARNRPSIDVFIHANNNAASIKECLDSILKTKYKHVRVFVVDDCSKDKTKDIVREYQKNHERLRLRLIARRQKKTRLTSLSEAIKKYSHGEIVMVISGSMQLNPQALKNAAVTARSGQGSAYAPEVKYSRPYSLRSLMKDSEASLQTRADKAWKPYAYEAFFYERGLPLHRLTMLLKGTRRYATYTSMVRLTSISSQPRRLSIFLIEPIVMTYFLYVAVVYNAPGYIVLSWLAYTGVIVLSSLGTQPFVMNARLILITPITFIIRQAECCRLLAVTAGYKLFELVAYGRKRLIRI